MSGKCQCIKKGDGKRCTRDVKKDGDTRFCWQHQECSNLAASSTVKVTPVKKPVSPVKKPVSPVKKPVSPVKDKKDASPSKKAISPVKEPEIKDDVLELGNNKIILNNCLDTELKDWIPIKFLGSGFNGSVYEVCKAKDCNYVLKILYPRPGPRKPNSEAEISRKAADLGIGPKVYDSGECDGFQYIIMQKLDRALDQIYPFDCSNFVKAIELYQKLYEEGIVHNDLKANNVMVDNKGKIYIVDYGNAKIIPKPQKSMQEFGDGFRETWPSAMKDNVGRMAQFFLGTLFTEADDAGADEIWLKDQSLNKYNVLMGCIFAVRDYLLKVERNSWSYSLNVKIDKSRLQNELDQYNIDKVEKDKIISRIQKAARPVMDEFGDEFPKVADYIDFSKYHKK